MKTMSAVLLALAISSALEAAPVRAATPEIRATSGTGAIERAEAREAGALLADAVGYLKEHGPVPAFKAFNDRKGGFVHGAYYVYVVGADGIMYANGGAPKVLAGVDVADLRDEAGKPFMRELLSQARNNDAGVVEYRWLNRVSNRVENKSVSFRKVGKYIVCVGYYIPRSTVEEAQALLDRAVARIHAAGAGPAYQSFNDPDGGFIRGDLYVFAIGINDGKYLAYGATPELSGTDALGLHDAAGKPLVQEMVALAKEKGSGTVDYVWRNPATNAVEPKHSLIRRVGDVLVGVGYYAKPGQ
jgi:cytochrome c